MSMSPPVSAGRSRLACGFFEGIKVYYDHVDGFDALGRQAAWCSTLSGSKECPRALWGAGSSPCDRAFLEDGEIGNIAHLEPDVAQSPRSASGRNQFHVHTAQLEQNYQASLIGNA